MPRSWTFDRSKGEVRMLGNQDAVANVAVKDLDVATEFYRNTLGLNPVHQEGRELVVFQSGHSSLKVAWFKDPDGNILNVVGR
jgi:catechol-2,3-dioxygenase